METSQQFLSESFSYGWSITLKSSSDAINGGNCSWDSGNGGNCSFDSINGGSYFEVDPHFLSMRWMNNEHANDHFDFDLQRSQSPALVSADQIFSGGVLLPFHAASPSRTKASFVTSMDSASSKALLSRRCSSSSPVFHSAQSTPSSVSSCSCESVASKSSAKSRSRPSYKNCIKSPKKILSKYLSFLMPFYKKVRGLRSKPLKPARGCEDTVRSSARTSAAFSSLEWCRSNADISIYDAILYCKRSNGLDDK